MSFDGAELEEAKTTHLAAGKLPRIGFAPGKRDDFCEQAE